MTTPPKLANIAKISNRLTFSPMVKYAKVAAKNGAKLPTEMLTEIGTKAAPRVKEIRPMRPITLLVNRAPLNSLLTLKLLPVHRLYGMDRHRETAFVIATISNTLTPF